MEARVCLAPHLLSLPHTAHTVAENLGLEGPHTYFSIIRLLETLQCRQNNFLYFCNLKVNLLEYVAQCTC